MNLPYWKKIGETNRKNFFWRQKVEFNFVPLLDWNGWSEIPEKYLAVHLLLLIRGVARTQKLPIFNTCRSSRPEVYCKKGVLRNFTEFIGKHLRQSLFFNKNAGLRHVTLLKKRVWHRCFPVNFVKLVRTSFFIAPPLLTIL